MLPSGDDNEDKQLDDLEKGIGGPSSRTSDLQEADAITITSIDSTNGTMKSSDTDASVSTPGEIQQTANDSHGLERDEDVDPTPRRKQGSYGGWLFQILKQDDTTTTTSTTTNDSTNTSDSTSPSLLESRTVTATSCAVCLGNFADGDEVTWSSNPQCKHCFHKECIASWLPRKDKESLCPCCRREFMNMDSLKDEGWIGDDAMTELKGRLRLLFQEELDRGDQTFQYLFS